MKSSWVISTAVAPIHKEAGFTSEMVTQGLMFESVRILSKKDSWYNINMEDEFIRIECEYCNENTYCINQFSNSDTLLFHILNDIIPSNIQFYNTHIDSIFTIGVTGTSSMITSTSSSISG